MCQECHSITYCGPECQREDWPRHIENCVPVMITEIPGKGVGLVASKDFKAGQLILAETPVFRTLFNHNIRLTTRDFCEKICKMSADMKSKTSKLMAKETPSGISQDIVQMGLRENCFEEIKICLFGLGFFADAEENLSFFYNKSFVNHSCSPNASSYIVNNTELTAELRAIKDISKGEEVTSCFLSPFESVKNKYKRRMMLRDTFGFDCSCVVCTGEVPDQEEIIQSIDQSTNSMGDPFRKTLSDWQHDASKLSVVANLAQKLYIGQPEFKFQVFLLFFFHSQFARDHVLLEKSLGMMRELVENTQLNALKKRFSLVEETHKQCRRKIKAKIPPTGDELNHFFIFLCPQVMIK